MINVRFRGSIEPGPFYFNSDTQKGVEGRQEGRGWYNQSRAVFMLEPAGWVGNDKALFVCTKL